MEKTVRATAMRKEKHKNGAPLKKMAEKDKQKVLIGSKRKQRTG